MTAKEIKKAVGMYSRIADLVKSAQVHNNARPDDDPLWVMCHKCDYYTDGKILLNLANVVMEGTIADCAAKYAEICINAGADESDIYLGY